MWLSAGEFQNRCHLFRELEEDLVQRILNLGIRRTLDEGEVLFLKGDEGDALYGVISGQVRISTSVPSGREVLLNVMAPGDVFGEIALLDGMPRTADAKATVRSELMMIRRRDFVYLVEREPKLALCVLKLVCARLRKVNEQVEDSALLNLSGRLAKQLLAMAQVSGEPVRGGVRVKLQPSQSELGQMLGTSRVSVNRHLQVWRKKGWIDLSRGTVLIRDGNALRAVVEASP